MAKHKTLGQVFTSTWIVNKILDLVGYNNEVILDKYILEPSSGDGVFLIEIVNRYINICLNKQMEANQIVERLEKYIYAVELDKTEFDKSIENLNALVKQKLAISRELDWKIYNQNTLDFFKKHLDFFDFVVGNPP